MILIDMLRKALRAVTTRVDHLRAIRQLQAMSDRELSDIGIVRAEIEAIVTGRVLRPTQDDALVRPTARVANARRAPVAVGALDAA